MADTFDVEVLSTGTHGGIPIDDAYLEKCIANHGSLSALVKAPVRLGHQWKDSDPACGWITGLKKVGNKLIAQLSDVPTVVQRAIKQRLYRQASIEMYPAWEKTRFEANHKTGVTGPAVCGVALLGAARPEVRDLADLETFLASEGAGGETSMLAFGEPLILDGAQHEGGGRLGGGGAVALSPSDITALVFTALKEAGYSPDVSHPRHDGDGQTDGHEGHAMTADDRKALMDEMRASLLAELKTGQEEQITALKDEVAKLSEDKSKADAEVKRLGEETAQIKAREREASQKALDVEAVRFAEKQLSEARIVKPQEQLATALHRLLPTETVLSAETAKAMGLAEKAWSPRDLFAAFVELTPKIRQIGEVAQGGVKDASMDARIRALAAERGLDMTKPEQRSQALAAFAESDPSLIDQYRTPTDPRRGH